VATDDVRIADEVRNFGGSVVMTSPDCANGTERCADAVARLGDIADIIVNLQGDAPLSPTFAVERLVARLSDDPGAAMATPAVRCSPSVLRHLLDDVAEGRVGGTTAVFDRSDRALYFSKRILPYLPHGGEFKEPVPVYLHLGMYAYRPNALFDYRGSQPSDLETLEGLEQLRFLDMGMAVSIVRLESLEWDSIELNNPSDVAVIERVLSQRGID
jgi:3-deoxy-manno-octulosonate cytidylyltransferase (CMP-KDO synthetase)